MHQHRLRHFTQKDSEHGMLEIRLRLLHIGKSIYPRVGTVAEPPQLWEDIPYPVAPLLPVFQLLQSRGVIGLLHVKEPLEVERIFCSVINRPFKIVEDMTKRRSQQTVAVPGECFWYLIGSLSDSTCHGTNGVAVATDRHRVTDATLEVVTVKIGDDGLRRAAHARHIIGVFGAYPVDGAVEVISKCCL